MARDISQIQTCIIAGGDINDPSSDHSCNQKIYSPLEHGPDVDLDHLGQWPRIMDAGSKNIFSGVPDPGSVAYVLKNTGQNGGILLGIANSIRGGGSGGASGGQNLMQGVVQQLLQQDIAL